ncbi:MAG: NDP-sugar synthase [Candidatus Omnitrophica bacterium]|nr:NDP-sugar synthase [Candidatus Omnitrophota bacterium]
MKALLLSGGEGTRLRPFTITTPKPLLPVANVPLISYQFELLKRYGITDIIVGVGYKADHFKKAVFRISKEMGVKAKLSFENKPLGTGGGLKNAYPFFKKEKEVFFVLNGDVIAAFNLDKILAFHKEKEAYATMCLVKISDPSSYGLVLTDADMTVKKFIEKPKKEEIISDTINAGLYIFSPDIFSEIPTSDRPVSLEREIFPALLEKGKKIYAYIHYGYWMDVGTIKKYQTTNFDAIDGKIGLFGFSIKNVGEGKLIIGKNSFVKGDVNLKGRVVIGDNCFIGDGCVLQDSIIMDNTVIQSRATIKNSVIGTDVVIENDCTIFSKAVADKSLIRSFTCSI